MAQYKVLDPEQEIPCPYNKCEMIRAKRMPYHLIKCRRNHPCTEYATCPLNAIHVVPKPELRYHIDNCPDKPRIEQDLSYEIQKKTGSSLFQGCVDLPEYHQIVVQSEDDWEKEVPLLPRIGVDPTYFAKIEGIHIDGLTTAEKKHMKSQYELPADKRRYLNYPRKPPVTQTKQAVKKQEQETEDELRIPKKISQTYISQPKPPKQQPSAVFAFSLSSVGVGRGQAASLTDQAPPSQTAGRGIVKAAAGRGMAGLGVGDSGEVGSCSVGVVGRGQSRGKVGQPGGIAGKLFSSGIGRGSH